MIPRFHPHYDWREWLAAFRITEIEPIERYEKDFAVKFGCIYGVMFSLGRSGLYALLNIWRVKNAEVICPAYTCIAVPNAIILSGNTPVFVDNDPEHFNMSLTGLRDAISDRTRVIIATHIFGYPMNVTEVQRIANEASERHGNKIYVIQDCAQSFGAKSNGKLVSTYGDAAFFGSNIGKIINSIFGGMVITNNVDTANRLRSWRDENLRRQGIRKEIRRFLYFAAVNLAFSRFMYGIVNHLDRKGFLNHFTPNYDGEKIELPGDWDEWPANIEARIGSVQLSKYDAIIETRQRIAKLVLKRYSGRADIFMLPYDENATYSQIVAIVDDRKRWMDWFRTQNTELGWLIEYSIPLMKAYRKYAVGAYPTSAYVKDRIINFPTVKRFDAESRKYPPGPLAGC